MGEQTGDKPFGCLLRTSWNWAYFRANDQYATGDCNDDWQCIEWIDPPIIDCPNTDGYIDRECMCHSPTSVEVTYDSQTYNICDGDTATVTWDGRHNIQEVTQSGYNSYNASEHIGSQIHDFENNGHSEVIDGLHATAGETRYFVCTDHPAKKFSVTCSTCLIGRLCNNGICELEACANNQVITSMCDCNGEEISSGYCHETYSSDKPSCTGNIRPCSCTESLDCQTDEYCTAGACTSQITQTITLSSGWNWLSIGVTPSDNDREVLFPNLENMDKIISRDDGNAIFYDFGDYGTMWDGRLTHIPSYQLLQMKLQNDQTITFSGSSVTDITIPTGWSSFGIPVGDDISIEDFGIMIGLENMDKIIARDDGNAIYYDFGDYGTMWDGRLKTIKPGQGYLIKKTTSGTYSVRQ